MALFSKGFILFHLFYISLKLKPLGSEYAIKMSSSLQLVKALMSNNALTDLS